jgi:hypothetical protein
LLAPTRCVALGYIGEPIKHRLCIALTDAVLLPSRNFGFQPTNRFLPERDGLRESTCGDVGVDRAPLKPGCALNLRTPENALKDHPGTIHVFPARPGTMVAM